MKEIAWPKKYVDDGSGFMTEESETINFLRGTGTYSVIIIGMGGSGKTALVWSLMDSVIDGTIMPYSYPHEVVGLFPPWIRRRLRPWDDWQQITNHVGNILYDDSVLGLGARSSATRENRDTQANMTIARHNGKRLWWTVQNTAMLDKLAWQSLEPITLHKRMPIEQLWTEREELIDAQLEANFAIGVVAEETGADIRSLSYCPRFKEVFQTELPEWWTDAVSTPYRGYYVRDGQVLRA